MRESKSKRIWIIWKMMNLWAQRFINIQKPLCLLSSNTLSQFSTRNSRWIRLKSYQLRCSKRRRAQSSKLQPRKFAEKLLEKLCMNYLLDNLFSCQKTPRCPRRNTKRRRFIFWQYYQDKLSIKAHTKTEKTFLLNFKMKQKKSVVDEKEQRIMLYKLDKLWDLLPITEENQIEMIEEVLQNPDLSPKEKHAKLTQILASSFPNPEETPKRAKMSLIIKGVRVAKPEDKKMLEDAEDSAIVECCSRKLKTIIENPNKNSEEKKESLANTLAEISPLENPDEAEGIVSRTLSKVGDELSEADQAELEKMAAKIIQSKDEICLARLIVKHLEKYPETGEISPIISDLLKRFTENKKYEEKEAIYRRLKKQVLNHFEEPQKTRVGTYLDNLWFNRFLPLDDLVFSINKLLSFKKIDSKRIMDEVPKLLLQGADRLLHPTMKDRTYTVLNRIIRANPNHSMNRELVLASEKAIKDHAEIHTKGVFLDPEISEQSKCRLLQPIMESTTEKVSEESGKKELVDLIDKISKGLGATKKKEIVEKAENAYYVMRLRQLLINPDKLSKEDLIKELQNLLEKSMKFCCYELRNDRFNFLLQVILDCSPEDYRKEYEELLVIAWKNIPISEEHQAYLIRYLIMKPGLSEAERKSEIKEILSKNIEGLNPQNLKKKMRLIISATRNKSKLVEEASDEILREEYASFLLHTARDREVLEEDKRNIFSTVIKDITTGLPLDQQQLEFSNIKSGIQAEAAPEEYENIKQTYLRQIEDEIIERNMLIALLDILINERYSKKHKIDEGIKIVDNLLRGLKYNEQREKLQKLQQHTLQNAPRGKEKMVKELLEEILSQQQTRIEDFVKMIDDSLKSGDPDKLITEDVEKILLLETEGMTPEKLKEKIRIIAEELKKMNDGKIPKEQIFKEASTGALRKLAAREISKITKIEGKAEAELEKLAKPVIASVTPNMNDEERADEIVKILDSITDLTIPQKKKAFLLCTSAALSIKEDGLISQLKSHLMDNVYTDEQRKNEVMPIMNELMKNKNHEEKKVQYNTILKALTLNAQDSEKRLLTQRLDNIWNNRRLTPEEQQRMIEDILNNSKLNVADKTKEIEKILLNYSDDLAPKNFKEKAQQIIHDYRNTRKSEKPNDDSIVDAAKEEAICEHAGHHIRSVVKNKDKTEEEKVVNTMSIMKAAANGEKPADSYIKKTLVASVKEVPASEKPVIEAITSKALQRMNTEDLYNELRVIVLNQEIEVPKREASAVEILFGLMKNIPFRREPEKLKEIIQKVQEGAPGAKRKEISELLSHAWNNRELPESEISPYITRCISEILREKPAKEDPAATHEIKSLLQAGADKKSISMLQKRNANIITNLSKEKELAPYKDLLKSNSDQVISEETVKRISQKADDPKMEQRQKVSETEELIAENCKGKTIEEGKQTQDKIIDLAKKVQPPALKKKVEDLISDALKSMKNKSQIDKYIAVLQGPDSEEEKMRKLQNYYNEDLNGVPISERRSLAKKIERSLLAQRPKSEHKSIKDRFAIMWRKKPISKADEPAAVAEVLNQKNNSPEKEI
eukprot:TRINITY_DN246_c0_g1_i3.p1 TRINITY_DN246_c0_g1~~TRINITY_DN246_c0_g1_i3.p1  ORF type:complete len:1560 (+),score=363.35 TRINITY_DN246_c0_g1_i3:1144-5823(+)